MRMKSFGLRNLFLVITVAFWVGVIAYALRVPTVRAPEKLASTIALTPSPQALPVLHAAEVARHGSADDCWVILDGVVYDLTSYVNEHPDRHRELESHCGSDGTQPWRVKERGIERGEPHSAKAEQLLSALPRVGVIGR